MDFTPLILSNVPGEERLRFAIEAGRIGVWEWNIAQDRTEWSDLVFELYAVDRHRLPRGMDEFIQLVHREDRERVNRALIDCLENGSPYDIDFRVVHPNGEVRWLSTKAQVLRDENGVPVRMIGATTDVTERKQAEVHLLSQWRTFDAALSNTPDFTYTFDLNGRFTYANRPLLLLLQKSLQQVQGRNFFELDYPPELAARLQRQIQQVIATRQTVRDQTPFTGPVTETRLFEYIFVPVLGPGGRVAGVAGSTRDVTERNEAEAALRQSEERLTLAFEAGGGVGAWDWDVPANRVYCNAQFARLYSVGPAHAAQGAPIAEFVNHIHPDDRLRVGERIRNAIRLGGDFSEEYRAVQQDGAIRWVYARGNCHLDEAGNAVRFSGVVFDITERKRGEHELRQSQDRLRAIYDGTYEYIGLLAPDGTLLEANRAALEFAGNTRLEVVGRPFWSSPWFAGTPGVPELIRDGIARAAAGESLHFEITLRRPSGETPSFDMSLHPIRNERGEVLLIVPEAHDITERKRAEEDLQRSNRELMRANRELEEFAYVASHDLQEPLRMVNIYTQLLLKNLKTETPELTQYAGFVYQGVHRMEALLRGLLTFSQSAQNEEQPSETADLAESLREALAILENRIAESGAIVAAQPLPLVCGYAPQMAHVFQNLLSNALKYRKPGVLPEIQISARLDGSQWIVSVRDNGIGFEPAYADRIFGLFKRLHKEEYPGTGLGLAICRRIVERYGGRIWAESTPGEGAVFHFALSSVPGAPAR